MLLSKTLGDYIMWNWLAQNHNQVESILTLVSVMISAIVLVLTYLNLKNLKDNQFEESRAHISVSIGKCVAPPSVFNMCIKNYGKSSGVIEKIETNPAYDKSKNKVLNNSIFSQKNISLAPQQSILTGVDLACFEKSPFDITIFYRTGGKSYTEMQHIDLSYMHAAFALSTHVDTPQEALTLIAHSVEELSDKQI